MSKKINTPGSGIGMNVFVVVGFVIFCALILLPAGAYQALKTDHEVFGLTVLIVFGVLILFKMLTMLLLERDPGRQDVAMFAFPLSIILVGILVVLSQFAEIYRRLGLMQGSQQVQADFSTCYYFSLATFTTLGYGDFQPTTRSRAFAGFEAVLGYLIMGILIGTLVYLLSSVKTSLDKGSSQNN